MKKAILLVSFGTAYEDEGNTAINQIENKVKSAYKDFEMRIAFTSLKIIEILRGKGDSSIKTPEETLKQLISDGFEEIIVQPLNLVKGRGYDKLRELCTKYDAENVKVKIGRPVLCYGEADENKPDDYRVMISVIEHLIMDKSKALLCILHGSRHAENDNDFYIERELKSRGYDKIYFAHIEGTPDINQAIEGIRIDETTFVNIIPLLITAGYHIKKDLHGKLEPELTKAGIDYYIPFRALGEIEQFQNIYIEHIKDAIENRFSE